VVGYGLRWLQDWRTDRTKRADRQRDIALAAQLAADAVLQERLASDKSMDEGYKNDARKHSEKARDHLQALERHAANLRDPEIGRLVTMLDGVIDEHYLKGLPWADVEQVRSDLRVRLGKTIAA
jgi:hypothetical protein